MITFFFTQSRNIFSIKRRTKNIYVDFSIGKLMYEEKIFFETIEVEKGNLRLDSINLKPILGFNYKLTDGYSN